MKEIFPAKILLFGEYTIITNQQALVVPLYRYSGRLSFPEDKEHGTPEMLASNHTLEKFYQYLSGIQSEGKLASDLNLNEFRQDIENRIWFQSDIPIEYGAGSSAALVGAVATRYGIVKGQEFKSSELLQLKSDLAAMESFFHGQSSGIDPLCAVVGQSILIDREEITAVEIPSLPRSHRLFLIDTGQRGSTGPLVRNFKADLKHEEFRRIITEEMAEMVNKCINWIISGSLPEPENFMHNLSLLQFRHFQRMIPVKFRNLWESSLHSGTYRLKLCGSGGGGFLLGYTTQWDVVREQLLADEISAFALDL